MLPKTFKPLFGILRKRLRLVEERFDRNIQCEWPLADQLFERTVDCFGDLLKLPGGPDRNNLRNALSCFYGKTITASLRRSIIWRIAAGFERLQDRERLANGFEQVVEETWTGMTIEDVRFAPLVDGGKARYNITFRIHSGLFSGLAFVDKISTKWVKFKLAREIGFPKWKPFNTQQLCGCVLVGSLNLEDPKRPKLASFEAPSSVRSYNGRFRKQQKAACIRDFPWACHECPIGNTFAPAGEVTCHRAHHSYTYVRKPCQRCGNEQSYFDPDGSSQYSCLTCQSRESRSRERIQTE